MRTVLLAATACMALFAATAEDEVLSWFPLQVGNRWVYSWRDSSQGAKPSEIVTVTWRREVRVKEHRRTSEGLLVIMEQHDTAVSGGAVPLYDRHDYLIRGHDIYEVADIDWLPDRSRLKPFASREHDVAFHFPLHAGAKWGEGEIARDDNMYCWFVEAQRGSSYTLVYRTIPDNTTVWFVRGKGVVATSYSHHGTYEESRSKLLRFIPAPTSSTSRPK